MSRILLKSLAVLGLSLASCSMPFFGDNGSSPYDARSSTPPHKGGLADSGDGFAKYFLNHDTNTPYSKSQGSLADSLLDVFSSHNTGFGAATARPSTYTAPYRGTRSLTNQVSRFALNRDTRDPYQN